MDDETDKAALDMEVLTSWKPGHELVRAFVDNDAFNFKARKIAAVCALMHDISEHRAADISGALHNHERHIPDEWSVQIRDTHYTADINGEQGLRTIVMDDETDKAALDMEVLTSCLLYTSPSPRDQRGSRMPSSA